MLSSHKSNLPLGCVSLGALHAIQDPVLRVLYLRNSLHFIQHRTRSADAKEDADMYFARALRNRLEHPCPGDGADPDADIARAEHILIRAVASATGLSPPALQRAMQVAEPPKHIGVPWLRIPPSLHTKADELITEARESTRHHYRLCRGWATVARELGCVVRPTPEIPSTGESFEFTPSLASQRPLRPGWVSLYEIDSINDPVGRLILSCATLHFVLADMIGRDVVTPDMQIGDMVLKHGQFYAMWKPLLSAFKVRNQLEHFDHDDGPAHIESVESAAEVISKAIRFYAEHASDNTRTRILDDARLDAIHRATSLSLKTAAVIMQREVPKTRPRITQAEYIAIKSVPVSRLGEFHRASAVHLIETLRQVRGRLLETVQHDSSLERSFVERVIHFFRFIRRRNEVRDRAKREMHLRQATRILKVLGQGSNNGEPKPLGSVQNRIARKRRRANRG